MKSPGKKGGGTKKSKVPAPDAELKKMADEIKKMSIANNTDGAAEKDKDSLPPHLQAIKVYQEPLPLTKSKQRIVTMNADGATAGVVESNPDPINIEVKNSDLFAGDS